MSVEARKWAKTHTVGNATAKAVLLAIADYADEHGSAFPSQRALAEYTEFKPRAIRQAMALLEDLKLLRCEERRRQDGGRTSDRLILDLTMHPLALDAGGAQASDAAPPGKTDRGDRQEMPGALASGARQEPSTNLQDNLHSNQTGDAHPAAGPSPAAEQRDEQAEARAARRREVDRAVRALCAITGRSDPSARSAIACWLGQTNDELTVVVALIDEADRRQAVDPTMWIQAQLRLRKEQLAGTLASRRPAFEQAPTGQAARLIQLSAKLQGDSDAAERDHDTDDLLVVDGEPEGGRGEDRGLPWSAGGSARPLEQLLAIARHGAINPGAAADLRRGRAAGGRT